MHWTTDLQRWAAEPVRLLARWRSGEKLDEAIDAAAESRLPDCDATIEWGVGVAVVKGPLGAQTARTRLGQGTAWNPTASGVAIQSLDTPPKVLDAGGRHVCCCNFCVYKYFLIKNCVF